MNDRTSRRFGEDPIGRRDRDSRIRSAGSGLQVVLVTLGLAFFVFGMIFAFGGTMVGDFVGGIGDDDDIEVSGPEDDESDEENDDESSTDGDTDGDSDDEPPDGTDESDDDTDADDDSPDSDDEEMDDDDNGDQNEADEEISVGFSNNNFGNNVGDIAEVEIETDSDVLDEHEMYFHISDPNSQFSAEFEIDDLEDGIAVIAFNSYYMGQPGEEDEAYVPLVGDIGNIEQFEFSGTHLEPGEYDIELVVDGNTVENQVMDRATLTFTDRFTDSATTYTAPRDVDIDDLSDIEQHAVRDDDIEIEDYAIIRVEASGIFGYIDLEDEEGDLSFTVEQQNPSLLFNRHEFGVDESGVDVILDPDNNQFFVVIDTDRVNDIEVNDTYRATFTVGEDNPYVDESESVSSDFTIVERSD